MRILLLTSLIIVHCSILAQTPNLHWSYQNDGKSYMEDRGTLISYDSTGNIVTVGYAESGCTGIDIVVVKYSSVGDTLWMATYNGSNDELQDDIPHSMAIDAAGNIYITGKSKENNFDYILTLKYNASGNLSWVNRNLNFESVGNDIAVDNFGNVIICGFRKLANNMDFIVTKFNSTGAQQWSMNYSNGNYDEAVALTTDAAGNIYVTGKQSGINFLFDWATVKYNPAGTQLWVDILSHAITTHSEEPVDIKSDIAGNIYVAGFVQSAAGTDRDYYVIKYNTSGNRVWEESYNYTLGNNDDNPVEMEVDNDGNVFVTGTSIGVGTSFDICTIKINSTGNFVWEHRIDSIQQTDYARAIVLDKTNNFIYLTGDISVPPFGPVNRDIKIVKLDTAGIVSAQYVINGPGNNFDLPYDMAVDASGNVAVAGMISMNYSNNGNGDVFTGIFDSQLTPAWSRFVNGDGFANDQGTDMVVDAAGNTYVCGFTRGGDVTYEDLVVFKVNSSGQRLWEFVYKGTEEASSQQAVAIAIDQQNNVYVTGTTDTANVTNNRNIYTAKLDPSGQLLWEHEYDGTAGGTDTPVDIAVDQSGVVYVAATTVNAGTGFDATLISYDINGTLSFVTNVDKGGIAENFSTMILNDTQTFIYAAGAYLPPNGHLSDGLLVKFDWSGTVVWDTVYDFSASNSDRDFFTSIALDDNENIFVAGQSNLNFVAAKYSPAGIPEWIQNYSHSNFIDSATVIAVDVNNDVLVAGTFGQPVEADFGIVKYKNDGTLIWERRYANSAGSDDILTDMVLDGDGNIYVTGWETSSFTTNYNMMTLKYDSTGTFEYELIYSGTNGVEPDYGKKLGLDGNGNIYVMGDANENCFGNTFVNGFRWNTQVLRYGQGIFSGEENLNFENENTVVYPNPATNSFFIKLSENKFGTSPVELFFYDIGGKLIHKTRISDRKEIKVESGDWKSGIIFYHAINENNSEYGKIIIVNE